MIFRKKPVPAASGGPPVPRSRGASGSTSNTALDENPLARRLRGDAEPDTVDLADPARFHEARPADEGVQTTTLQRDPGTLGRVISRDPATGKLYIHPGSEKCPVLLQSEAVAAPTELRRGDTIQVGEHTLKLLDRS